MKKQDFEEIELIDGKYRVEFSYENEGLSGDYDPDDEDDVPLLRFYCYEKVDGEFEAIDDTSYCTQFETDTPRSILEKALKVIMNELKRSIEGGSSGKKAMEAMSWLGIRDFEGK